MDFQYSWFSAYKKCVKNESFFLCLQRKILHTEKVTFLKQKKNWFFSLYRFCQTSWPPPSIESGVPRTPQPWLQNCHQNITILFTLKIQVWFDVIFITKIHRIRVSIHVLTFMYFTKFHGENWNFISFGGVDKQLFS